MKLYHGSDVEIASIDLSKSLMNKDFGRGFYLSDDLKQARDFAQYKADKPKSKTKTAIVTAFEFPQHNLTDGSLKVLRFEGYSVDWVRFIKANRQVRNPEFDVVIGPIANDDVRTQFALHMMGEITEDKLMESLKWKRCTYQYCFISQKAVEQLKTIGKV